MSGFGTDVLAVGCILGSAAASTAATMAWMERDGVEVPCAVEEIVRPRVIVTTADRKGTVVVSRSDATEDGSCASASLRLRVSSGVRMEPSSQLRLRYEIDVARQREMTRLYRMQLAEMQERMAELRNASEAETETP